MCGCPCSLVRWGTQQLLEKEEFPGTTFMSSDEFCAKNYQGARRDTPKPALGIGVTQTELGLGPGLRMLCDGAPTRRKLTEYLADARATFQQACAHAPCKARQRGKRMVRLPSTPRRPRQSPVPRLAKPASRARGGEANAPRGPAVVRIDGRSGPVQGQGRRMRQRH